MLAKMDSASLGNTEVGFFTSAKKEMGGKLRSGKVFQEIIRTKS